jgi:hypothetical protein
VFPYLFDFRLSTFHSPRFLLLFTPSSVPHHSSLITTCTSFIHCSLTAPSLTNSLVTSSWGAFLLVESNDCRSYEYANIGVLVLALTVLEVLREYINSRESMSMFEDVRKSMLIISSQEGKGRGGGSGKKLQEIADRVSSLFD